MAKVQAQVLFQGATEEAPPSKLMLSDGTILVPVPNKQIKTSDLPKTALMNVSVSCNSAQQSTQTSMTPVSTKSQTSGSTPQVSTQNLKRNKPLESSALDDPVPVKLFKSSGSQSTNGNKESSKEKATRTSRRKRSRPRAAIIDGDDDDDEDYQCELGTVSSENYTRKLRIRIKRETENYNSDGLEDAESATADSEVHSLSSVSQEEDRHQFRNLDYVIKTEPPDDFFDLGNS